MACFGAVAVVREPLPVELDQPLEVLLGQKMWLAKKPLP